MSGLSLAASWLPDAAGTLLGSLFDLHSSLNCTPDPAELSLVRQLDTTKVSTHLHISVAAYTPLSIVRTRFFLSS